MILMISTKLGRTVEMRERERERERERRENEGLD
jgi:hypothetical protein